ncbi:kinase-like domain-containing protein [Whalleya microplaca]|nr:kinase-like domain-containing protein [Whalleya microplaca]
MSAQRARFPDNTFATKPEQSEPQPTGNSSPSCQLLVAKAGGRDMWALGSRYILKKRGFYPGSEVEVQNTDFAAEKTTGQVAKVVASWKENDRFFLIQERIEGEPLEDALPNLSQEDIARIGRQVGEFLRQFRNITSPTMQMLDGRPVIDRRLFKPLPASSDAGYSVCTSDADVVANMSLAIKNCLNTSELDIFMAHMPSAMPFTYTHSDVHEGNIMVKDGRFQGLIDFELSGFYPRWWEFVNSCEVLSEHLPADLQDKAALDWFRVYHMIRERPEDSDTWKTFREYLSQHGAEPTYGPPRYFAGLDLSSNHSGRAYIPKCLTDRTDPSISRNSTKLVNTYYRDPSLRVASIL